jgi:hypothetical protein
MKRLRCWKCREHKDSSEFYKNKTSSTGFEQMCRICKSAHSKARRARRKLLGLCPCGAVPKEGYETCQRCRDRREKWGKANTEYISEQGVLKRKSVRQKIFDYYGWVCACCGEDNPGFLTIDHVYGGGNQHRKRIGGGNVFYAWLIREGYPKGYQTLCYNCNCGKGHSGGICPHETAQKTNASDKLTEVAPIIDEQNLASSVALAESR